jgi:hypothetical protein
VRNRVHDCQRKTNLVANSSWPPRRIHYTFVKRALTDQQECELATRIAIDQRDKALFHNAANFQSNAMRMSYEIQSITREVAGSLQSVNHDWSSKLRRVTGLIDALKS